MTNGVVMAANVCRCNLANIALGPVAGPLGRTALGGRNWEGFTVDPYLSGVLTAETIKGIQDAGVIANLKVRSKIPWSQAIVCGLQR